MRRGLMRTRLYPNAASGSLNDAVYRAAAFLS